MIPQLIAVANGKGGTFKTTLAGHLAALLALAGYRVLVITLDPQGDLLRDFGLRGTPADDQGQRLYNALIGAGPLEPFPTGRERLDIIAAGDMFDELEVGASDLYETLVDVAGQWDLIVLDCPPGNKTLQRAALYAARWLLVPTKADANSLEDGVAKIAKLFMEIRGDEDAPGVNPDIELLGVVLAGIGMMSKRIREGVRVRVGKMFGDENVLLKAFIRHADGPPVQARLAGKLAHELDIAFYEQLGERYPTSAAGVAGDHQRVAGEVAQRLTDRLAVTAGAS